MSFVNSHATLLATTVAAMVFFAQGAEAQSSCERDFRSYDDVTEAIKDSLACMAQKIDEMEADARPRLDDLRSQIDLAADTTGKARAVSKEAEDKADDARSTASRAEAIVADLENKIAAASEIVTLLEGVEGLEDFLANNTEFQRKIASLVVSVPVGTVAAFDLESCPIGWDAFDEAAGRVLIGVGTGTNLTQRQLRDTGGAETHKLEANEMPRHSHQAIIRMSDWPLGKDTDYRHLKDGQDTAYFPVGNNTGGRFAIDDRQIIQESEGGESHENMPPYIALSFCKKKAG